MYGLTLLPKVHLLIQVLANLKKSKLTHFMGHFLCHVVYMKIYIRNMLCSRCKMVVEFELERLGFLCRSIEIGCADIVGEVNSEELIQVKTALQKSGLELVDNKRGILVDKIKSAVIDMIQGSNECFREKSSVYLASKLDYDYTYLANVFSETESTTIEQFIIVTRIQAAKELLINSELNLTEISWKLNYSSVAHLSTQFKKMTGVTPSIFRQNTVQVPENV